MNNRDSLGFGVDVNGYFYLSAFPGFAGGAKWRAQVTPKGGKVDPYDEWTIRKKAFPENDQCEGVLPLLGKSKSLGGRRGIARKKLSILSLRGTLKETRKISKEKK